MVARFQAGDTGAYLQHHTGAFMAQNGGEHALRIGARQGKFIRMANAGGLDFHQNLTGFRAFKVHFHNFQRFACFYGNSGSCTHFIPPATISGSG